MENKSFQTNNPIGQSPEEIISAFCILYKEHTVVNRIWLWYKLAEESGQLSEQEKQDFALFIDQLKNLVAAVYNFHQANRAGQKMEGEPNE